MSRSRPSASAVPRRPAVARRPRAQDPRRFGVALESAYLISFEWDIERDEVRRFHSSAPVLDANADRPARFETVVAAVHPDDQAPFRAAVQAAIDDPAGRYESEFRLAPPLGGPIVWLYERGRIERGRDGRARRLIGVSQDITPRKEAEQRLRASEERFRRIFEHTATGIVITDTSGWFEQANDAYLQMLGYTAAELQGRRVSDLIHPDDRDHNIAVSRALVISGGTSVDLENRYLHRSGHPVWVHKVLSLVRDEQGRAVQLVSLITDITARVGTERALRDADRQKDEFLAMLSHELRNTLAPIRTSVGILRASTSADLIVGRVGEVVDRQVTQMARLLDDLLDVSRLTRESLSLQRRPTVLADVLDAAVETSRPLLTQNALRLAIDQPAEPVVLEADAARLTQVFANLLNNAAKYSHPGGAVTLTVRVDGPAVAVTVCDTGIGIATDMLPRVFDLFAQGAEARSHAPGGLGIGLSLAQRLVDMHGGRIEVRSPGPGQGSAFTVRLPLVATPHQPAADRAAPDQAEAQGMPHGMPQGKQGEPA